MPEERIEEFHPFAPGLLNSLLGEMEDWQRQLQAKSAAVAQFVTRSAGPAWLNRAAFVTRSAELMQNEVDHQTSGIAVS